MLLTFSGGHGTGNACGPKHFHGFEKIEQMLRALLHMDK